MRATPHRPGPRAALPEHRRTALGPGKSDTCLRGAKSMGVFPVDSLATSMYIYIYYVYVYIYIYTYARFKELILKHLNDMFHRKKMLLFQMGMFDSWRMKNFASGYVLEYRMAIGLGKYLTHLWDCFLCVTCDIDNIITHILTSMRGLQKMWIWASRIRVKNHPGGWIQGDTRLGFCEHLWTSPNWGIPWASGQSQIFPVNEAWIELGKSDSRNCIIRYRTDGCWEPFWMSWASVGSVEDFDVFLNISKPKVKRCGGSTGKCNSFVFGNATIDRWVVNNLVNWPVSWVFKWWPVNGQPEKVNVCLLWIGYTKPKRHEVVCVLFTHPKMKCQ